MPYNNAIPQPTDYIPNSQPPLLGNFQEIQTLVGVNHVNFNVADQGKHKFVTFPVQVPPIAPLANEINLYSVQSAFSAQPELAYQRNAGNAQEITTSLNASPGWCFTSSGILLKWGQLTALAADYPAGTTLLFPVAATIPVYGTIFTVYVTTAGPGAADTNTAATLKAFNTVGITVAGSQRTAAVGANTLFNYLAVGVQ